jgi:peroxiredoxin
VQWAHALGVKEAKVVRMKSWNQISPVTTFVIDDDTVEKADSNATTEGEKDQLLA